VKEEKEKKAGKENVTVLDKAKKEHKQISEEMELLKISLPYLNKEESYNNVRKVINFFKEHGLSHFEYEEREIFPIALAIGDLEIKQIVRELQQQHIIIISKFDIIIDIISKHGFSFHDERTKNKFIEVSKEMLGLILQHAHKEDTELFPYLEDRGIDIKKSFK
jgi:hemerythrin-like domain-containing protein